jgi:hypothetical protein
LLLSVSLNISLPIVTVIVLLTSLSLLPINFSKFIVPLPAYPDLNLPKIRYIDIPETTIVGHLLNKDVLIVPDRINSTQCGTEIIKKPTGAAVSNLFSNPEKPIRHFCSKKISFKPLTNLKGEHASNVHAEAKR